MTTIYKTFIVGSSGRMGVALQNSITNNPNFTYIGGVDGIHDSKQLEQIENSDIILDFSSPLGNKELLDHIKNNNIKNKSILIGTTGLTQSNYNIWKEISTPQQLNCLFAPNTSLGIYLLIKKSLELAKILTDSDFDIEIEETHHRHKKDTPSGTALYIAETLAKKLNYDIKFSRNTKRQKKEIGIQSTRAGGVFGNHTIRFISEDEEFSISHKAINRNLFAKGALTLSKVLNTKKDFGFYELKDIDLLEQ